MNAAAPDSLPSLRSLQEYAEPFARHPPALFDRFPGGSRALYPFDPGSDRGLGILLLTASLYRPGAEQRAAETVAGLYERLGNDVFKLNRLPFENAVSATDGEDARNTPGILRSVCDFFYRIGPLGAWLAAAPDWETRVRELAGEIYWMGKQSKLHTKARYFLWLCSFQPGFAARFPQALDFAWPVGEGHLRFYFDVLKAKRTGSFRPAGPATGFSPEQRLRFFRDFGLRAFPDAPWKLAQPMDAFLRRGGTLEYLCRTVQGGCRPCPLSPVCPAARNFLSFEA